MAKLANATFIAFGDVRVVLDIQSKDGKMYFTDKKGATRQFDLDAGTINAFRTSGTIGIPKDEMDIVPVADFEAILRMMDGIDETYLVYPKADILAHIAEIAAFFAK